MRSNTLQPPIGVECIATEGTKIYGASGSHATPKNQTRTLTIKRGQHRPPNENTSPTNVRSWSLGDIALDMQTCHRVVGPMGDVAEIDGRPRQEHP
jgi:hypothetical protein